MISREETPRGVITINKAILNQLVQEAAASWITTGKLKLANERTLERGVKGVKIEISISLAIGVSMTDVMNYIIDFLADQIKYSLELPIDDITVLLTGMYTRRGTMVPRAMRMSFSDSED